MKLSSGSESRLDICLHFSNTKDWHGSEHPVEKLQKLSDLISWSVKENIIDKPSAIAYLRASEADSNEAKAALVGARDLRESIYRIFSSFSHDRAPQENDLHFLNQNIARAFSRQELMYNQRRKEFHWGWKKQEMKTSGHNFDQILLPIVKSAADLLVSDKLHLVKECANETEGCGWLFIDSSKNHSRRWCSMRDCGNRSKVRSYYERNKQR